MHVLERSFYERDTLIVARELLGKVLVHRTPEGTAAGVMVEVEAYIGPRDKGAHSYGGRRTARTEIQYGPPGYAYVFFVYGMHYCFNVVTAPPGRPEVVLVRALEPVEGLELMARRRGLTLNRERDAVNLCNGPGRLCAALAIGREQYGADLCGDELFIADTGETIPDDRILATPRINIDYAEEYRDLPWRFVIAGHPCLSKP